MKADRGAVTAGVFVTAMLVGAAECPTGISADAALTKGDGLTAGGTLKVVELTPGTDDDTLELARTAAAVRASSGVKLPAGLD